MEQLLEIKDLRVQFKTERATSNALNGVTLSIGKGESLGLVGETAPERLPRRCPSCGCCPMPPGSWTGASPLTARTCSI